MMILDGGLLFGPPDGVGPIRWPGECDTFGTEQEETENAMVIDVDSRLVEGTTLIC